MGAIESCCSNEGNGSIEPTNAVNPCSFNRQDEDDEDSDTFASEIKTPFFLQEAEGKGGRSKSQYKVLLDKKHCAQLGLAVDLEEGRIVLPVAEVNGGLAQHWNQTNPPDVNIHAGDMIVEVNGTNGNARAMVERCQTDAVLAITLQRG
eukprot:TRINITY_DN50204_c0_g1_i1.p1 TRINITY_DN50204_c0_g1~~TRINITY_DN50204_c0_g1_i1.p1  ORF type:complete len:149 (-),score=33.27 TRINITY_DN50204_c0_g1_i1:54-500(-)